MKHRYTWLSLGVFMCALFIVGCINYEQDVTLNMDGSGSMKVHYWAKESNVMWLSNNKLAFDESKIREQYKSPNITVKSVKVESDMKDSTKHVRVELEFKDITKLTEAPGFKDMKITWEDKGETQVLTHVMKADTNATQFMSDYSVTYMYHMPAEVLASNATKPDGKNLIWKYNLSELSKDITLQATVKKASAGSSTILIIIVIAAVVVIGGILILTRRKA